MKVLVCGGRDYADSMRVERELDALAKWTAKISIIEGGASGADAFAHRWAQKRNAPIQTFRADWEAHGKAAGPIRNAKMLAAGPDLVLAFPGGKGTADMVRRARLAGVKVCEVSR